MRAALTSNSLDKPGTFSDLNENMAVTGNAAADYFCIPATRR